MGMSSGGVQSSDSQQHPPKYSSCDALKQSSPKPEHHGHSKDRKDLSNERNGEQEHLSPLDSDMTRKSVALDQKPKNNQSDSETEDSQVEHASLRKYLTASHHKSHQPDKESCDDAQFDYNSLSDTPPRKEGSADLKRASLLDGDSSCIDESTHFDNRFPLRQDSSQFDSTFYADEELSTPFDTTVDSSSRNDALDSTREGETSEAEESENSFQVTSESMLESSLNNTSQLEESSVDLSNVSNLCPSSQPGHQGSLLK